MDGARWQRIQSLFHEALNLSEAERNDFLSARRDSTDLIAEVWAMLQADSGNDSFLDSGLPDVAEALLGTSPVPVSQQEFGPYRLQRLLGEGGMGVVWLAQRQDAGNLVAIKFLLHAELSPARRERFTREIRMLGKLTHPSIARLYDAGTLSDGTPWFVMEYVEGARIHEYCAQRGLTLKDQLRLFRCVCEAVQYAHGQEIIHRDLKPSNILVDKNGSPRLLDFGIARELHQLGNSLESTKPALRFCSPRYAAPEWTRDGVVGMFTDVYSLGIILREMLTGQPADEHSQSSTPTDPAQGSSVTPSVPAKRSHAARTLSKSEWRDFDVICTKATHPDPAQRYPSIEALMRDVDHLLKSEPLEARPETIIYRTGKFVRRNRTAVLAVSAAIVLIVGMVVVFTVRLARAKNAALAEASRREKIQWFMLNLLQGGDKEAGPAKDQRVVTLIDHGAQEAQLLSGQPEVQADLYQTLGSMYQKLGKLDLAGALLQTSLNIREGMPENRSDLAESLIALGLLRSEQGKYPEAEQSIRRALESVQKFDPQNKPLLARAEAALGTVLVAGGHQAESVDVLKHAMVSMEAQGRGASADLSRATGDLADAQLYLGHYEDAVALNQRALAIDSQIYGGTHPHVADDLGNLGQLEEIRGYYADAERYVRQALQIDVDWYGADHPESARKMTTLASVLNLEGKFGEAENLLRRAVSVLERAYGDNNERVAYVLNALGGSLLHDKKFTDAEGIYQRVIGTYRSNFGDGDYRVAVAMDNLSSVYAAEQRYGEAETLLLDVVNRLSKSVGPENIQTGIAEVRLGRTMLHERKYREAAEHTRAGYEALRKQTSPQTSYVQGALHDLIADYTALGDSEQADDFQKKLSLVNPEK
jgi:eukaryotic-like serine/threonine-protein kinase